MRGIETEVRRVRREVFKEVANLAYNSENLINDMEALPYKLVSGEDNEYWENNYRERAVVRERLRLAMGMSLRQEDKPVRDYLPCLRLSDGRVGMYDLVEDRVSFSDGTEELTAGEKLLPERSVSAVNGEIGESVTPPELPGFLFQGYFTGPNGTGEQILDENGKAVANAGTEDDLILYAFWVRDEAYFDEY